MLIILLHVWKSFILYSWNSILMRTIFVFYLIYAHLFNISASFIMKLWDCFHKIQHDFCCKVCSFINFCMSFFLLPYRKHFCKIWFVHRFPHLLKCCMLHTIMSQRIINLLRRIVSKSIMSDSVEKIRLVYTLSVF